MKLPLEEQGHEALRAELAEWDGYVASALLGVEAIRACARYGEGYAQNARAWLEGVALLPLDDRVLDEAATLPSDGLRSLDALHLATALTIRDEIGAVVTYDERLAAAAVERGFRVVQPCLTASPGHSMLGEPDGRGAGGIDNPVVERFTFLGVNSLQGWG